MSVLLTGCAGFIGFHVARTLLKQGVTVVGLDNLDPYYDPALKRRRLELLVDAGLAFHHLDLCQAAPTLDLIRQTAPDTVIHLAAQAGIRHSLTAPRAFVDSNLMGFFNVLEGCRETGAHLLYASSSSVYGADPKPFSEGARADQPLNLYAATKRANELMAHAYGHLHGFPCTGLRFFTVYGPWGRPDMALFKFTRLMQAGQPIDVYGHGQMQRDFTYVSDVVSAVLALQDGDGVRVFNVGHSVPVGLLDMIRALEAALGVTATKNMLPMQPGDARETWADTSALTDATGWTPQVSIEQGIAHFVDWYRSHYAQRG